MLSALSQAQTDHYWRPVHCRTVYDFDGELGQLDPASLGAETGLDVDLAHVIAVGRKDYVLRSVHPQVRGWRTSCNVGWQNLPLFFACTQAYKSVHTLSHAYCSCVSRPRPGAFPLPAQLSMSRAPTT